MNPIDVVRTRFFNQPYVNGKGQIYSSGLSAVQTIFKKEGPSAFYKGFTTHFLRIGPHFCLTFVFLGMLRRNTADLYTYLDHRDTFKKYDTDNNGKLDRQEVKDLLSVFVSSSDIPRQLDRVFSTADSDRDDMISFQEYRDLEREMKLIYREITQNSQK